jgi:histidinol-phosphate aminotransferase
MEARPALASALVILNASLKFSRSGSKRSVTMPISRRSLLRTFGASAAGAAVQSLGGVSGSAAPPQNASLGPILLYRNENAYGPSEKVLAVLREGASFSNRYPRTEYDTLIAKIAAFHAVKPEQVALGCGSSEILRSAAAEFLGSGKKLIQASPTCPALGKFAQAGGVQVVDVPINKMYQHDLDAMLARVSDSAGLIYICNPNNPTGTLTPRRDIESFIRKLPAKTMVLIDEAYHHFVNPNRDYASFLDQPLDDPRVMVVRTFSKVYGLAGMRVGYVVAAPDVARRFSAERLPSGVTVISAKTAAAALDDSEYVRFAIKRNADDLQEFMNRVNGYMLRALDSHTNFVMLNPMRPPEQVIEHFKKNNILIGPLIPAMPKYIRVSLGTPAEMQQFWNVWGLLPATGKMAM